MSVRRLMTGTALAMVCVVLYLVMMPGWLLVQVKRRVDEEMAHGSFDATVEQLPSCGLLVEMAVILSCGLLCLYTYSGPRTIFAARGACESAHAVKAHHARIGFGSDAQFTLKHVV